MKNWVELVVDVLMEMGVDTEEFNKRFDEKVRNQYLKFQIGEDDNMRDVEVKLKEIERFRK